MPAVYTVLVGAGATAAVMKADIDAQMLALQTAPTTAPQQLNVISSNMISTAVPGFEFTMQVTIQYNVQ